MISDFQWWISSTSAVEASLSHTSEVKTEYFSTSSNSMEDPHLIPDWLPTACQEGHLIQDSLSTNASQQLGVHWVDINAASNSQEVNRE
jgi:hypothetical protein